MGVKRDYLYYVLGSGSEWAAICVDLDLAVEAESRRDAIAKMEDVFHSYVEDAMKEEPPVRDRLLSRSSPWSLRFKLWLSYQLYLLRRSRPHKRSVSAVAIACPA